MRKFKAWDKGTGIIVDVQEINYKYEEIVYENGRYTEVSDFKDIELLQSTGLLDKNGKEIYEGDIVKHVSVPNPSMNNKHFEVIQTRSGEWRIDNYRDGRVLAYGSNMVEVVGNKFEHRGLLDNDSE